MCHVNKWLDAKHTKDQVFQILLPTALKATNMFSLGLMLWSKGLMPHMWAALLTSQVALRTIAYLRRPGMK